jgi:hypothetical protein
MTVIDRFLSFTRELSAENRASVEEGLAALMDSYSERYAFTPDELSEIDHRLAEPKPEFASAQEVAALFGKPFSE